MGQFGGNWTDEKLERLRKYLYAYNQIMKERNFDHTYIDAFAGTGYRTLRSEEHENELLLPELGEDEPRSLLEGSARVALNVEPAFRSYIFIEKDPHRYAELQTLKEEFPQKRIDLINRDANEYLIEFCRTQDWRNRRAVLFLDPYGLQVDWTTIQAVAETKAIDMFYWFPLGVAVNRLLKRDGQISQGVKEALDRLFGGTRWYAEFYSTQTQPSLFGDEVSTQKTADFEAIQRYLIKRLQSIFTKVVEKPLALYNSKNNPLYLLCFAAGNEKGAPTAVKIAQHVLKP